MSLPARYVADTTAAETMIVASGTPCAAAAVRARARRVCRAAEVSSAVSPGVVTAIAALRQIGSLVRSSSAGAGGVDQHMRAIARLVQGTVVHGRSAAIVRATGPAPAFTLRGPRPAWPGPAVSAGR